MKIDITKELFYKLFDPTITKGEYDSILESAQIRACHIWRELLKVSERKLDWYDFDNENGEGANGYFDPFRYKEFISFNGAFSCADFCFKYGSGFPTEFLWMEDDTWKQIVLNDIEVSEKQYKDKQELQKKKKLERELKKEAMKEIIISKLTPEELKYIEFK